MTGWQGATCTAELAVVSAAWAWEVSHRRATQHRLGAAGAGDLDQVTGADRGARPVTARPGRPAPALGSGAARAGVPRRRRPVGGGCG